MYLKAPQHAGLCYKTFRINLNLMRRVHSRRCRYLLASWLYKGFRLAPGSRIKIALG
ncbi:hypothetical protein Plhal304r1_c027g0089471 [Plasmopara halstedii]